MLKLLQRKLLKMFTVVALLLSVNAMWGQQSITALNTATSQNFNSIGASSTATLPAGFRVSSSNPGSWSSGTATATTQAAGSSGTNAITGSSTYGIYNYADGVTASSTDRAIGFLTSSNAASYSPWSIIYAFTNNTGSTVTSLEISFDYEKYRTGTRAWDWTFFHGNTATVATSATDGDQSYAEDSALGAVSPVTTISKSFTLSGLSIATGTTYYLKWVSTGNGGKTNSQGIGLDNFSIKLLPTSVPTYTLVYDANTGTGTAPTGGSYQAAASFTTATQGGLTKSGYNFTGWNTAADGSGTGYAANTAYTMPAANLTLYAQWALNTTPIITASGTLSSVSTIYGTASATPTSFTVSGSNLTAPVTINAPAGYELVVSPATDYAASKSITPAANTNYTINVRLAATTAVGSYAGNITLTSTGATSANVATASSTVSPKALTISGLTGNNKEYDSTLTATVNGSPLLSSTANGDVITLNYNAATFAFLNKTVGTGKAITASGYTISGTNVANYTLTQPTGLTGNITIKTVTISGATVSPKTYDGTNAATVSGTINTISGTDNLVLAGTYVTVNAGTGITVNLTLSGTDVGNYNLAPTSTTGIINKATPVYTSNTISIGTSNSVAVTNYYTTSSDGVLTYTIANTAVASISGTTITAGDAVASTTLTVSQAASTNYNAGSINNIPLNVTSVNYLHGDFRTTGDGTWLVSSGNTTGGTATWEKYTSATSSWAPSAAPNGTGYTAYIANAVSITGGALGTPKVTILNDGYLTYNNSTQWTFLNLLVKQGGTLELLSTLGISTSGNFEIENGAQVIYNISNKGGYELTSSLWRGIEIFHPDSKFIVRSHSTGSDQYFLPADANLTPNTSNGVSAYFGNLIFETEARLTLSALAGKTITHKNLEYAPKSNFAAFYGSGTFTVGGNLVINQNSSSASTSRSFSLTPGNPSPTLVLNIKGDVINNSINTLNLLTSTSSAIVTLNVDGNISLTNQGKLNANPGSNATINVKGNVFVDTNAVLYSTSAANFNFTGTTPQTVSFASTVATLNQNINFNIKSGATTLLGSNFVLGSGAKITAETGSILNLSTYALTDAGAFESKSNATIITSGGLVSGIVNAGTKTFTAGTNYTFNGVTTTPFPLSTIGNTGIVTTNATVTLNRNITSQGSVVVNTGTFDLDTFTIDRNTAGGSLSIATDATLKIGGTNGFPANYNTLNFSPNSTVEYGGQAQQVGNLSAEYKNVVLSGTGAKSFVNGTIVGNNLTLQSGPTVTIPSNTTITVGNSLINNATAESFVINNNGALLQTGTGANTGANTGAITVLKNANPLYRLDYTIWAAPVENQKLIDFSSATASNRFYEYKYATNAQNQNVEGYWSVDASNVFSAAKGYLIRMPNTDDTAGYNGGTATLTFEGKFVGKPHTGDYNITASTAANRFTAVGNPYPSPIGVEEFYAQNSDVLDNGATIFLWRKRNSTTQASSYAKLTRTMFTANGSSADVNGNHTGGQDQGTYFSSGRTFMLAAGQGFIVKTKNGATATDIKFTNSMRKAAPADGQAFLRTAQIPASRLWINIAGPDGGFSQSGLAYLANATTGIDYGYDGKQLIEQGIVSLYSVAEGTALVIQARPEFTTSDVVPMGYNANVAGNFTISIDHTDGLFAAGQNVYLKDKAMGITRNISETDYTFTTEAGTFEDRFELVYTTEALGTDNPVLTSDNLIVYKNGESININAGSTRINAVTVFDIRGRKLYSQQNVNNTEAVVSGLTVQSQVLIVEIATEKGIVSKKIIF